MRLAFLLYQYFPAGGRQRNLHYFVEELKQRGHTCRVYCLSWHADVPDGVDVRRVPARALRTHRRYQRFISWVDSDIASDPVDGTIGFDAMPGLDIYCAPGSNYNNAVLRRGALQRYQSECEQAICATDAGTHIFVHSAAQANNYEEQYATPTARLHVLPPGIAPDRRTLDDAPERRKASREALGLESQEFTLLFVGLDFEAKGLQRAIITLANMREAQPSIKSRLLVVGSGNARRFQRLAKRLGVVDAVQFLGARDDIPDMMSGADLLLHPAVEEPAGIVLLEALAAGLPIVATDVCGYAHHVKLARAGILIPQPFSQEQLDRAVMRYMDGIFRAECRSSALLYTRMTDFYSRYAQGADLIEQLLNAKSAIGTDAL